MADGFLKRTACQIAAQLPDDQAEAFEVLGLVRQIVTNLGSSWEESGKNRPIPLFAPGQKDREESPVTLPATQTYLRDITNRG